MDAFQSTRPRGARLHATMDGCYLDLVSIHAPARGATLEHITARAVQKFQSTRPRGARLKSALDSRLKILFQSTRPRGARLAISLLL